MRPFPGLFYQILQATQALSALTRPLSPPTRLSTLLGTDGKTAMPREKQNDQAFKSRADGLRRGVSAVHNPLDFSEFGSFWSSLSACSLSSHSRPGRPPRTRLISCARWRIRLGAGGCRQCPSEAFLRRKRSGLGRTECHFMGWIQ